MQWSAIQGQSHTGVLPKEAWEQARNVLSLGESHGRARMENVIQLDAQVSADPRITQFFLMKKEIKT